MNCWCIDDWEFDDDERIIRLSIKENSYFKVLNTYFFIQRIDILGLLN